MKTKEECSTKQEINRLNARITKLEHFIVHSLKTNCSNCQDELCCGDENNENCHYVVRKKRILKNLKIDINQRNKSG